ncbi:MAG: flavodoxin reductase [Filimonas sp.]|nr:flavodoxin reductase [Filimonas sp.]
MSEKLYKVKVLEVISRTHNVHTFRVEKPSGFSFTPGQATELSILKEGWEKEKRPFTFTALPEDAFLEFTIKSYDDHNGVTNQLNYIKQGDHFEIGEAWGAIHYNGEGTFFAGGAGITPFICIFRYLHKQNKLGNNKLIFSNKTDADIILEEEFTKMLGDNFINIITKQENTRYTKGYIDKTFLEKNIKDFSQHFYVCGPDAFTASILQSLEALGASADALVFEK